MKNGQHYSIHPEIAVPPEEIITEVLQIVNSGNTTYRYSKYENLKYGNFDTYNASDKLKTWVGDNVGILFDGSYHCIVQVIRDSLAAHVDTNRTQVYNFLIDTGGDAKTVWRQESSDDSEIVEECVFPSGTWCKLDVSVPHGVVGISGERIAISVGNVVKINRAAVREQRRFVKSQQS